MRYRLLALLSLTVAFVAGSPTAAAPDAAQVTNHAGIVIQFGSGQVATACVAFAGPSINGFTLLQQSGLDVVAQDVGGSAAVCRIGQQGCAFPSEACFCQCPGGTACRYWTYWHLSGGQWRFSSAGASSTDVQPGAVDGWSWGAGTVAGGSQPPPISFDRICALPAAATASPVHARPSATAAPLPLPPTATRRRALPPANTAPPVQPLPTANISPPRLLPTADTSPPAPRTPTTGIFPAQTVPVQSPTFSAASSPPVATTNGSTVLPSTAAAGTEEATPSVPSMTATPSATLAVVAAAVSETPTSDHATPPVSETTIVAGAAGQRSGGPASSRLAGYLLFAVLLLGLTGAIIVVRRRS